MFEAVCELPPFLFLDVALICLAVFSNSMLARQVHSFLIPIFRKLISFSLNGRSMLRNAGDRETVPFSTQLPSINVGAMSYPLCDIPDKTIVCTSW